MKKYPIGIFDSGVGGTSIWKEIQKQLPHEHTIYLADSKNAPYGEKSPDRILQLSIKNTEFLLAKGCKVIVVACNTATTNAIAQLRTTYKIPFIGIEPAIKPAALQSRAKIVGVLATRGTLASHLFHSTSEIHAKGITIIEREGAGLVPLIEDGQSGSDETSELLLKYLQPMLDAGIDALVLGCTHYPYLIPLLKKILPADVQIIDSGAAVARQTKAILVENSMLTKRTKPGEHEFFTNVDASILKSFVESRDYSYSVKQLDF